MPAYENKITIGELEADCDDLITEIEAGQTYLVVDEDDNALAVLMPYSMYEEYVGLREDEI